MSHVDRVILRRWNKAHGGTVIAVLPDVPANPGRVMMYERVGQHGEGDYTAVLERARPCSARDADARALLRELRRVGYKLRIMRRLQRGRP